MGGGGSLVSIGSAVVGGNAGKGRGGRGGGGGSAAGQAASKRRRLTEGEPPIPREEDSSRVERTLAASNGNWGSPPSIVRPQPITSTSWPSLGTASSHLQNRQSTPTNAGLDAGSVPTFLLPKHHAGTIAGGFDPDLAAVALAQGALNGVAAVGESYTAAFAPMHAMSPPARTNSSSSSSAAFVSMAMPPPPRSYPSSTQPNEAYNRTAAIPNSATAFGSDAGWLEPPPLSTSTSESDLGNSTGGLASHRQPMIGRNSWTATSSGGRGGGRDGSDNGEDIQDRDWHQGSASYDRMRSRPTRSDSGLSAATNEQGRSLRHGSEVEPSRTKLIQARLEDVLSRVDADQMCEMYIKYVSLPTFLPALLSLTQRRLALAPHARRSHRLLPILFRSTSR